MIEELVLPRAFRRQIAREAHAARPRECCGLIEGRIDGHHAEALAFHPARNVAAARDRFEIDPEAHFRLLRRLRGGKTALIGCYHSHPHGRAAPSKRDCAGAGESGFLWLIAGFADDQTTLGAFVWEGACFRAVPIVEPAIA